VADIPSFASLYPELGLKIGYPIFHPLKHDNVPYVFSIELAIFIHQTGHIWPRP
jgi:hypothetical protein